MSWVYQNEQKCMLIFWSLRAISWSVTNAKMHSSFLCWYSLSRESFMWCSASAGKLLAGWQVTLQSVLPSSAISQPSTASWWQSSWFSQLGLTPAHRLPRHNPAALYQSLSKERWSPTPVSAAKTGLKNFHLLCQRPHHCKWSAEGMESLSITPRASWEWVKVVSLSHLNMHSLLSRDFYSLKMV